MQQDTRVQPLKTLLDNALASAHKVSSSVGLLSDLYGELGVAKQDADAVRLAHLLEMIFDQAEAVACAIERATEQAGVSARDVRPMNVEDPRPRRTASSR